MSVDVWMDLMAEARLCRRRKLNRVTGCLSEDKLRRLMRNDRVRAPFLGAPGLPRESRELAFELHLSYLIEAAALTPLQEACVRMRLDGLSYPYIAWLVKRSQGTVFACVRSAFRLLRHAYRTAPHAGWYEVYVSEVTRRPMG